MSKLLTLATQACLAQLQAGYREIYGSREPDYSGRLRWATQVALAWQTQPGVAATGAEPVLMATLAGQAMLHGKQLREGGVSSRDWLQVMIALLWHDLGRLPGVCRGDRPQAGWYASGGERGALGPRPGEHIPASQLRHYRSQRSQQFAAEHCQGCPDLDLATIQRCIAATDSTFATTANTPGSYPSVTRAAALVGRLATLRLPQAWPDLCDELALAAPPSVLPTETPRILWQSLYPRLGDGLRYLEIVQAGQQILAQLYANLATLTQDGPPTSPVRPAPAPAPHPQPTLWEFSEVIALSCL